MKINGLENIVSSLHIKGDTQEKDEEPVWLPVEKLSVFLLLLPPFPFFPLLLSSHVFNQVQSSFAHTRTVGFIPLRHQFMTDGRNCIHSVGGQRVCVHVCVSAKLGRHDRDSHSKGLLVLSSGFFLNHTTKTWWSFLLFSHTDPCIDVLSLRPAIMGTGLPRYVSVQYVWDEWVWK